MPATQFCLPDDGYPWWGESKLCNFSRAPPSVISVAQICVCINTHLPFFRSHTAGTLIVRVN